MKWIKKPKFLPHELKYITEAITSAESKTTAEIVPFFINQSDRYEVVNYRVGVFCGLILMLGHNHFFPHSWSLFHEGAVLFTLGMVVGYIGSVITPIRRLFLFQDERNEEVHQKALECFYQMDFAHSPHRNGVLIFISFLEKKVEILTDVQWVQKTSLTSADWKQLCDELVNNFHQHSIPEALTITIEKIGKLSHTHFPLNEQKQESQNHFENSLRAEVDLKKDKR